MKILADAGFPRSLHHVANSAGIVVERLDEPLSDAALVPYAEEGGYRAILLLDAEMATARDVVDDAERRGIALICSVDDDPLEAEVNFRRVIESLSDALASENGVWWLRRDGMRRAA